MTSGRKGGFCLVLSKRNPNVQCSDDAGHEGEHHFEEWDTRDMFHWTEAQRGDIGCFDCGLLYTEMHDLIIPLSAWKRISPTGNEGGLLCANCICGRLHEVGISNVPAAFMSGPLRTISSELMTVLRQTENLMLKTDAEPEPEPLPEPLPNANYNHPGSTFNN